MLTRLISFAFLLLAYAVVDVAAVASCSSEPAPTQCCIPTQLLFLLDRSNSIREDISIAINFMKRARCLFQDGRTQTGLITFNRNVTTTIPLSTYTSDEWYAKLDDVTAEITPLSPNTPMAEAFWLARKTLEASPATNCDGVMNRVVIVLTDGFPVQNMPFSPSSAIEYGLGGDTGVTQEWLATQYSGPPTTSPVRFQQTPGESANYNEVIVPEQAKLLKDITKSRIVMVAMKGMDDVQGRVKYFRGEVDPKYQCASGPTKGPTKAPSKAPTYTPLGPMGACPPGATPSTTQCYRRRFFGSPPTQPGKVYGSSTDNYIDCVVRNMTKGFPIATDAQHVIGIGESDVTIDKALSGTGPLACPPDIDQCFTPL